MNDETLNYIAIKIITDIRANNYISNKILDDVNSFPLVDFIRNHVIDSDFGTVISLINDPQLEKCYLGLNLINKIQHISGVQNELINLWNTTKDFKRKYYLMWPLLNYQNLPIETHKEIFQYIKNNWELWEQNYLMFANGFQNIIPFSIARYYDDKFPESKKWIYLLSLKILNNKTDILMALNKFKISQSEIMDELVIDYLIN